MCDIIVWDGSLRILNNRERMAGVVRNVWRNDDEMV